MLKVMHSCLIGAVFLMSLGFASSAVAAAAGTVIVASGRVQAVGEQNQKRELGRGSKVFTGERITTGANSNIQIRFTDNGLVSLQSNADYRVDSYQYKGANDKKANMTATIIRGKMVALTGGIAKKNPKSYVVKSKVATIAITGTHFATEYRRGVQTLQVFHGNVIFSTRLGSILVGDRGRYRSAIVTPKSGLPVGLKTARLKTVPVLPRARLEQTIITRPAMAPSESRVAPTSGGVYVNVGISRDDLRTSWHRDETQLTHGEVLPCPSFGVNAGAGGWDGLVALGFNYVWHNDVSLGVEGYGDASSLHGTPLKFQFTHLLSGSSTSNLTDLRVTHSFGISFLPGFYIAPGSLYFLDFGFVSSDFQIQGFPDTYPGALDVSAPGEPSLQREGSGFHFGFGSNTQLGSHLGIRQEYVLETYPGFSAQTEKEFSGSLTRVFIKTNNEIEKYNLALVYYFAPQTNPMNWDVSAHVGEHFYVGINGSRDEALSDAIYRGVRFVGTYQNEVVSDDFIPESGTMKISGLNMGLLGGYGINFNNHWYAGFELFGNYDDVSGSYEVNQLPQGFIDEGHFSSRFSKQWDFGAAFLPGYQVTDSALLYARVGYVGAEFKLQNSWAGGGVPPVLTDIPSFTPAENAELSFSKHKWLNGLQLGVGVDTLFSKHLSLRTEFNINNFGNYEVNRFLTTFTDPETGTVFNDSVLTRHKHIIEDQFNVALIWACN